MKKILIVSNSLKGGGAEKVLLDILKALNGKYEIDLFLFSKEGVYLDEAKKYVKKIIGMSQRKSFLNKYILLRKIISLYLIICYYLIIKGYIYNFENKYDCEIAFIEGLPTRYIANRKNNSKKIAWVHTDLEKYGITKYDETSYKKIDKIICVSQDSKYSLINIFTDLKNKIEVIYNFIPQKEIKRKALAKQKEIIKQNDKITIISVGRLSKEKGFDILLKAHKELLEEKLDYNLIILGEGPLRKEFNNYIKINKIQNNTKLLGFKKNPYKYMKEADIFVMASRYEGYPLVLCEALVLGLPVIATNCTGPKEILENGKYGILVNINSVKELKNSIRILLKDKIQREKYKKLAIKRAILFENKSIIKKIEDILDEE